MKRLFSKKVGGIVLALCGGLLVLWYINTNQTDERTTDSYTTISGTVASVISVSGTVEAHDIADLAFPTAGVITDIYVTEGDSVTQGDILATQAATQLAATRAQRLAARDKALAALMEVQNGATAETTAVSITAAQNAEIALSGTIAEQTERVAAAYTTWYSTDLAARAVDPKEDATPPTITGSYTCTATGTYALYVYPAAAESGYAYNVSGLETATAPAYTDQPGTLGSCGLSIQFTAGDRYGNSNWEIMIPNPNSTSYQTNKTAVAVAKAQATRLIEAAQSAVTLATKQQIETTADARRETVAQREADVRSAEAALREIDAAIADRSIVSPLSGTVTSVGIKRGEIAATEPVITVLADGSFEMVTRIPEIDITKLALEQPATITFDAARDEAVAGVVTYIAPVAHEIDGVAYFEAKLTLTDTPAWLRAGLNADVDIVIDSLSDVIVVPHRYLDTTDGETVVWVKDQHDELQRQPVTILAAGSNGVSGIIGVTAGTVLYLPAVIE